MSADKRDACVMLARAWLGDEVRLHAWPDSDFTWTAVVSVRRIGDVALQTFNAGSREAAWQALHMMLLAECHARRDALTEALEASHDRR